MDIKIIEPVNSNIKVQIVKSVYCPDDKVYITTDPNGTILWMDTEINKARKSADHWEKKYRNLMNGLRYWEDRALSAEKKEDLNKSKAKMYDIAVDTILGLFK